MVGSQLLEIDAWLFVHFVYCDLFLFQWKLLDLDKFVNKILHSVDVLFLAGD